MSSKFDFLGKKGTARKGSAEQSKAKTGRPPGKRSDPDMVQVTAYIRKNTHLQAKRALLELGMEFSELVESLVSEWLHKHSAT
jgi:hypothetical protein